MELPTPVTAHRDRAGRVGLLVLLAVMLAPLLWRITWESSLWTDETYTLLMSKLQAVAIFGLAPLDTTPPGYYLALRGWNLLGEGMGLPPSLFWSRLMGVAAWLAAVVATWRVVRSIAGPRAGGLITWCAVIGAQAAFVAKDLRIYALSVPAITLCLLVLLEATRRSDVGTLKGRRGVGLWSAYAMCGAAALWCHLLAGVALAMLGLMWLVLAARRIRTSREYVIGGALAQAGVLLLFAPWFGHIADNLATRAGARAIWLTPPNSENLLKVFINWYPFGQRGLEGVPDGWQVPLLVLGGLSALLPLGAAAWTAWRQRGLEVVTRERQFALLAGAGMLVAAGNVVMLWGLDRYLHQAVFHGPRYTVHTAAAWGLGLGALMAWTTLRAGWHPRAAWLLMLPWLACNVLGQGSEMMRERRGGLAAALRSEAAQMPAPGSVVYATPAELIPYLRTTLRAWRVEPATALAGWATQPALPGGATPATILRLSNWELLRSEGEATLLAMAQAGALSEKSESWQFPSGVASWDQFTALRLVGPDRARIAELAARGFASNPLQTPAGAIRVVHPRDLLPADGWNEMGVDGNGSATRWSRTERALIRLPGRLKRGEYTLRVMGVRSRYPGEQVTMRFGCEGQLWRRDYHAPAGWNDLHLPLEIEETVDEPVIWMEHPIWHPNDYDKGNLDGRPLGFLFAGAWIEERKPLRHGE